MKSDITKSKILCEAEKHFISNGIHNTQMKEIAESLSINRRTLYRYYPTKDELAFGVELVVLKQLNDYFSSKLSFSVGNSFDDILTYFESINIDEISDQLRFTAEFDRYFQKSYPNKTLESTLIEQLNPIDDKMYILIQNGIRNGYLRDDLSADEIYHFLTQTFLGLFQRLVIIGGHLENEYCGNIDFKKIFAKVILDGVLKRNIDK